MPEYHSYRDARYGQAGTVYVEKRHGGPGGYVERIEHWVPDSAAGLVDTRGVISDRPWELYAGRTGVTRRVILY